jgi:hypothetical protein
LGTSWRRRGWRSLHNRRMDAEGRELKIRARALWMFYQSKRERLAT